MQSNTNTHPWVHRRSVADDIAKRVTSDLCGYTGSRTFDVAVVIDMYEWVREGNVPAGEMHDIAAIARRWDEYRSNTDHVDWMRRAFGE
jgi:hypothetical protein